MHPLDAAVQATDFDDDLIRSLRRYTNAIAADMLRSHSRTQQNNAVIDAVNQVKAYRPTDRNGVKRLLKRVLLRYFNAEEPTQVKCE